MDHKVNLLCQKFERFRVDIKAILDKTTEDGQFAPTDKELLYISRYQIALDALTKYFKLAKYDSITAVVLSITVLISIIFPINPFMAQWGGFILLFALLCNYLVFRKLKRKNYKIAERINTTDRTIEREIKKMKESKIIELRGQG